MMTNRSVLHSLSDEEFDALPDIPREEVLALIAKGRASADAARKATPAPRVDMRVMYR